MKDNDKALDFPYPLPWEDFERSPATLATLRQDRLRYEMRLETHRELGVPDQVFSRSDLGKMLPKSICPASAREALITDLYLIGVWYLGPRLRETVDCDLDSTRRELRKLQEASPVVAKALGHLDALLGKTIRHIHSTGADMRTRTQELDLQYLALVMGDLNNIAGQLVDYLAPKQTGRRAEFHLDIAVSLAAEAIEGAGMGQVKATYGSDVGDSPHFKGEAGTLLGCFFKLVDRHAGESRVARSFLRERSRRRKASSKTPMEMAECSPSAPMAQI